MTVTALILQSCDEPENSCLHISTQTLTFNLVENSEVGTLVGDVSVEDATAKSVSYAIISGNIEDAFNLDTNTGVLTVNNSEVIDYEKYNSFELALTVMQENCQSQEYSATINISNIFDAPYIDEAFSLVSKDELVVYGEANADHQVMDVYWPTTSTERRPLLVIAGGGRWYGSDLGNFIGLGNRMAKAGYVVAAIRYISDRDNVMDPQIRTITGVQDLRAAIRYFRRDADNEDKYLIDTDNIFLGGFGTGAFLALQTYIDDTDLQQSDLDLINDIGGFEGEHRGNAGYSSDFKAIISMAGALYDLNWIDSGEPPIMCIHATNDMEVPFNQASIGGGFIEYGPQPIIERAAEVGLYHQLIAINSSDHDAPVNCPACNIEVLKFLEPLIE